MKKYLLQLSDYNIWANNRFIQVLSELTEDQLNQEINSSFPNIRRTVKHLYDAEFAWYNRLDNSEFTYDFTKDFDGSFNDLIKKWVDISAQWYNFILNSDETKLESLFKYRRMDSEYESKVSDALIHLFNHATYHRGQLITMLRQAGCTKIPSTDYILYIRSKA